MSTPINKVAVAVAGVAYWLVQAVWYTTFREPYLRGLEITMEEAQAKGAGQSPLPYLVALLMNLLVAYAIAWILAATGGRSAVRGAKVGVFLWLAFVMATFVTTYMFEMRPLELYLVNGGAALVGFVAIGLIVGAWKWTQRGSRLTTP